MSDEPLFRCPSFRTDQNNISKKKVTMKNKIPEKLLLSGTLDDALSLASPGRSPEKRDRETRVILSDIMFFDNITS